MSPRAAWRLERLGFTHVFDYVAGKEDWLSYGLPREGKAQLAVDAIDTNVPICGFDDDIESVRKLVSRFGYGVVVNEEGVVMGRIRKTRLEELTGARVEDVMEEGPTTARPSEELGSLLHSMSHANVIRMLITRSDGTLFGVIDRERIKQPGQ
jgi:predicted transcriptional regulator